jgi:hypothetical protein
MVLNQQKDEIKWRWSADGMYFVASTYEYQFSGSFAQFPVILVWKALAEPKCKFFGWLALHGKILTADNMIRRNWECNYNCSLCLCIHGTTEHLLTSCNYTEATWNLVSMEFGLHSFSNFPTSGGQLCGLATSCPWGQLKTKRRD